MASILDLLKAKGIDPSKLSSSVPQQTDDLSDIEQPPQTPDDPSSTPQPTPSPLAGPTDKTGPGPTDNIPLPAGISPDTFSGFPKQYDSENDTDSTPDSDDDSDDSSSSASSRAKGSGRGSNSSNQQALQSLINGFTNNTVDGLKKAQDEARNQINQDSIMRAVNTIAGGLAGSAYHAKTPDLSEGNKFYDQQDKDALQKVKDFQDLGEQEKNDPTSSASVGARQFAAPMLQTLGIKLPDNISYNTLEKISPMLTKAYDTQVSTQEKSADLRYKYDMLNSIKQQGAVSKQSAAQDKSLQSTQQLLESARGNPAAAQAEKDIYASDKANSLANLYGDPNKLNPAMTQLLATEVAKIASGGTPSIHELDGLNPQTLNSTFAGTWQKLVNSPTPANAGAFVKQYQDYANALTKDAQKVIQDKYGRVIESRKAQLGPDNYDSLKANYLDRFAPKNAPATVQASGKVTVSNGSETYQIDPSDLAHAQTDGFKVVGQ